MPASARERRFRESHSRVAWRRPSGIDGTRPWCRKGRQRSGVCHFRPPYRLFKQTVLRAKARNSFYSRCDVVNLSEQLLSLGEIRKDLFELITITDEILSSLKAQDRILISYKYFGEVPEDENFDHTSRNYFRKQKTRYARVAYWYSYQNTNNGYMFYGVEDSIIDVNVSDS